MHPAGEAAGWRVLHILGDKSTTEHPYTSPARIVGGRLTYSAEQLSLGD